MAAFGMSRYGRDARGRLEEGSRWQFDRAKNAIGRADDQYGRGDYFNNYLADRYGEMSRGRFGTAEDLTAEGNAIMPWLDPMMQDRLRRVGEMSDNYNAIGPISETIDQHSRRFDEMGGNIGRNYDALDTDITNLQTRSEDRENATHNDIVNNIQGGYGSLRSNNQAVYGSLLNDTRDTYNKAISDVMPGSIARSATAARAFAPQVASTMLRLRRAGIDPASSEAQALLRNVEGQRSRAMDDKLGESITDTNNLRLGRLDRTTGLTQDAHNNEIGFGLGEMGDMNREWERNLNNRQGIDRDMTGLKMDNRDVHFERGQNFLRDRGANDLLYRGMREQDVNNRNQFLERANEEDAFQHDLKMQRYNTGVDARGRDIDYQNQGLTGLGNVRDTSYNQANFQDNYARGSFGDAAQTDEMLWRDAQASGNWAGKLLTGIGATAADYFLPGSGQIIRGAAGQGQGQGAYPSQGQGGGYGQYRTPNYNPNAPYSSAQWDVNNVPRFRAGAPSSWVSTPNGGYNAALFRPTGTHAQSFPYQQPQR